MTHYCFDLQSLQNYLSDMFPVVFALQYYKEVSKKGLELNMKINDGHRSRWTTGDWTDDSDQMIVIIDSIIENGGKVLTFSFSQI